MLTIKSLQPLAVKGLINYSIKKKDLALFKNVLFKSLYKKFEFSWIEQDVYKFCLENNNWEILSEYLEKKKLPKNNVNKKIFSFVYYQLANGYYNNNKEDLAKKYLIKALNLNKYFPPFIEFYCKIDLKKDKKELIKLLKNYWNKNPNPNIEKCINLAFTEKNNMSKLKISTMVITNNSHLYFKYLILGKFKYHAKLWGASKSDLKKSIENNPSREAYYYLHKIEDNINKNTNDSKKWHNLYKKTQDKYFWKCKSCGEKYINWNSFCISCKQINCITINSKSFEIRNYNSLENSAKPYLRDFYK